MNFGFSCFRKLFCCFPKVYQWGKSLTENFGNAPSYAVSISVRNVPLSGVRNPIPIVEKPAQGDWVNLSVGEARSYGILADGSLWGWGTGPLGDGRGSSTVPTLIDVGPWKMVSTSGSHTCAIKADDTLWQWGPGVTYKTYRTGSFRGAYIRAKLSAGIASAVVSRGGQYTKTPTAYIAKRKANNFWAGATVSEWTEDSGDEGEGATAEAVMDYKTSTVTITNPGSGYKSVPAAILSDGEKSYSQPVTMSWSFNKITVSNGGSGYTSTPTATLPQYYWGDYGYWPRDTSREARLTVRMGCLFDEVTVTDGGSGYTEQPMVLVNGAYTDRLVAVVNEGQIEKVLVLCTEKVDDMDVRISFLSRTGSGATATAVTRMNHVVAVDISDGGSGYSGYQRPVVFTGGGGSGAYAYPSDVSGFVTGISLWNGVSFSGSDNRGGFSSPPTISIEGAQCDVPATATVSSIGAVTGVKITSPGSRYTRTGATIGFGKIPLVLFTRQNGDTIASSDLTDAIGFCDLEPSPIDSLEIIDGGNGYSTASNGTVPAFTTNPSYYGTTRTGAYLTDGTKTVRGAVTSSSISFPASSGWAYPPYIIVEVTPPGVEKRNAGTAAFSDGYPFPKVAMDLLFEATYNSNYGLGAAGYATVGEVSEITSTTLTSSGEGYVAEPTVTVRMDVLFPRQIGSSKWKDVACGDGFTIAIGSDSLVYRWGNVPSLGHALQLPALLGKRVIATQASLTQAVYYDKTDYFIGPPNTPGEIALFRSDRSREYGNWGGHTWRRYQYVFDNGTFQRSDGFRGGITGTLTRGTVVASVVQPGYGYTAVPECQTPAGSVTLALYGPDACRSVHVSGGLCFAIGTDGKVWFLNGSSGFVDVDSETDTKDDFVATDNTTSWTYGDGDFSPSTAFTSNTTQRFFDEVDIKKSIRVAYLSSSGSGYTDEAKLIITGTKWRHRIVKSVTTSINLYTMWPRSSSEGFDLIRNMSSDTVCTLESAEDYVEPDYPAKRVVPFSIGYNVYTYDYSIDPWDGSVSSPALIENWDTKNSSGIVKPQDTYTAELQSNEGFWKVVKETRTTYTLSVVLVDAGTPVVTDSSGTGAVYTTGEMKTPHGMYVSIGIGGIFGNRYLMTSAGPVAIGLSKSWNKYTGTRTTYDTRAITSDNKVRYLNPIVAWYNTNAYQMSPGPEYPPSEQKDYAGFNNNLGVDDDQSMWLTGSPVAGRSHVQGDVELTISDPGRGYTEPVSVTYSDQPSDVAEISCVLDGSLDCVAVVFKGKGYNSPPTVTVAGDSGATAVGKIAGPLYSVTVDVAGTGYIVPPKVTFSQPGISATAQSFLNESGGVRAVSVLSGGYYRSPPTVTFTPVPHLESISVTNGGQKYSRPPDVVVVGGRGTGATATCDIDGKVVSIVVDQAGIGYTSAPTVRFVTNGKGSGATAIAGFSLATGEITGISVLDGGTMYQSPPVVVIEGGGGFGATATAKIEGRVHSVSVLTKGGGYYDTPSVFFLGGGPDGSGAEALAITDSFGSGATATARINGSLIYCNVTNAGSGYAATPAILVSGGDNPVIADADSRLSDEEITQAEYDEIVAPYKAKCTARVSGPVTLSVPADKGGNKYGASSDSRRQTLATLSGQLKSQRYFLFGANTEGIVNRYGTAASGVSVPPGGPLTSIAASAATGVQFTSRPEVVMSDAYSIAAKTSLRLCGIALKNPRTSGVENTSYLDRQIQIDRSRWSRVIVYPAGGTLKNGALGADFYRYLGNAELDEIPTLEVEGDTGSGATITTSAGSPVTANLTSPGSGYSIRTQVVVKGGKIKVTAAVATATVVDGRVISISVTSSGSGYAVPPAVVIHGGGGNGAKAVANMAYGTTYGSNTPGGVRSVSLVGCGGSGYTSAPTVSFVDMNPYVSDIIKTNNSFGLENCFMEYAELDENYTASEPRFVTSTYPIVSTDLYGHPYNEVMLVFDDGFLDSAEMRESDPDSRGNRYYYETFRDDAYVEKLPPNVSVNCNGNCDSTAVVSIVRPSWSNVLSSDTSGGPNTAYSFLGMMAATRDTTQP
jgi:hypothetical protein